MGRRGGRVVRLGHCLWRLGDHVFDECHEVEGLIGFSCYFYTNDRISSPAIDTSKSDKDEARRQANKCTILD